MMPRGAHCDQCEILNFLPAASDSAGKSAAGGLEW
jgi:hypothetical protein